MAIGLGALQTVLEEGNKDDWFGSPFIVRLSIIAAVALAVFLWIEFSAKRPLIISRASRATTPNRSAWFLPGPACRSSS
jgi:hypothetical protein